MVFHHRENLAVAQGLADRDSFGNRGAHGYRGVGVVKPLVDCGFQGLTQFTLKRHDLREGVDCTRVIEVFESLYRSDKERAVTDGNDNVVGNAAELLENLVDVGFRTFIEIPRGNPRLQTREESRLFLF